MNKEFDPHQHEKYYQTWRKLGSKLDGVTPENIEYILAFLKDMEIGANVNPSSKKGARGYGRLRNLKSKMQTMAILFQKELKINSFAELESKDLEVLKFFNNMREGKLPCRIYAKPLKAVGTYVRIFKSFWHWYERVERRKGRQVLDITMDVDARDEKPKFSYFTIEGLKKLCDEANYEYRMMMLFLFDSGIRAPTEFMNVKVSDLEWKSEYYNLNIRAETSKTFGRKIKLLLCSKDLKEYIAKRRLSGDAYLFRKSPQRMNQYLRNLGYKVLKLGIVEIKVFNDRRYEVIKEGLSMYDFRHCSACYWLPRYKSESALKYRFGWKKSEMIHYYTELLGMKDTIENEDMCIDVTKTVLEQKLQEKDKVIEIMQDRMDSQENKMKEMMDILRALQLEKLVEQRTSM